MVRLMSFVLCLLASTCLAQAPPPPGPGPGIEAPALLRFTEVNALPVLHHNDTAFFMVSGLFESDFTNHMGMLLKASGYPVIAEEFVISNVSPGKFSFSASVMLQLPGSTQGDLDDAVDAMNDITPNLAVLSTSPYAICRASVSW